MFLTVVLFIVGLFLLIKGGDWFVDGATAIAKHYHVSELLIGATVVSIGTTLPEVMVSSISAVMGHGEIAYGNAVGSVICNTALISAITMAIRPSEVNRKSFLTPVLFFFASAAVYVFVAWHYREFSRLFGAVLLLCFVSYIVTSIIQARKESPFDVEKQEEESTPLWKSFMLLIVGAIAIAGGAKLLVDNATIIAQAMGVPEAVIVLTLVALGTSLPELTTAIIALVKGHSSLSVGNIVGANLFNIVLVSGMATVLSPFELPADKMLGSVPTSLAVDSPVMFLVMGIMTIPALLFGRMFRIQGIVLLLIYFAYCTFLFCY